MQHIYGFSSRLLLIAASLHCILYDVVLVIIVAGVGGVGGYNVLTHFVCLLAR